jgi:hypothetical protein
MVIDETPADRNLDLEEGESGGRRGTNQVNVVTVAHLSSATPAAAGVVSTDIMFDPDAPDPDDEAERNVMKDKSVKYRNTKNLSKKTQNIYENLPPIVASVNINKVSKNLMKAPNKVLSKRLARIQLGLQEGDEEEGGGYSLPGVVMS